MEIEAAKGKGFTTEAQSGVAATKVVLRTPNSNPDQQTSHKLHEDGSGT
jgi:hypothetical protein